MKTVKVIGLWEDPEFDMPDGTTEPRWAVTAETLKETGDIVSSEAIADYGEDYFDKALEHAQMVARERGLCVVVTWMDGSDECLWAPMSLVLGQGEKVCQCSRCGRKTTVAGASGKLCMARTEDGFHCEGTFFPV